MACVMTCFITKPLNSVICLAESKSANGCTWHDWRRFSAAAQHSQSPYNVFAAVPGLKVVVPSSPYDVKGLLIQAIRDDDPVVFCEHKMLYDIKGEVPDDAYTIPFGVANYTREGTDVTIIALGLMVHRANEVADKQQKMAFRLKWSTLAQFHLWMKKEF